MAEIFTTSGEKSGNAVTPTPRLQGLFVPGIDNPLAVDGFGIVTPWGGGGTARKYTDYGISGDISRQSTQLYDLASSLIPVEGGGISYGLEGPRGLRGFRGERGLPGIITFMGLNLPQNSNFLAALPHNLDQINDLGTAVDKLIYTSAYTEYVSASAWTERQPAGDVQGSWLALDSDSDGSNLIVADYAGRLYTSSDYGVNWTERQPAGAGDKDWRCVASDSDGSHLVAGILNGRLYTSSDGGATWAERQPAGDTNHPWISIASDSDGSHLAVIGYNGRFYVSSDYGVNWTERSSTESLWFGVASDSTGLKLIASIQNAHVYISDDQGASWTAKQPAGGGTENWRNVTSDSDGTFLTASMYDGDIYTSDDSGATWTLRQPSGVQISGDYYRVASDSDGSNLIAGGTYTYISNDSGVTWTKEEDISGTDWGDIASDADGSHLVSGRVSGRLYTYAPGIQGTYSEATWAEAALTSAGRALLDDADATAQAVTLGLVIGTDVQAYGAVLDDLNTLGAPASDGQFVVATGAGVFAYEATTTARTSLGVGEEDTPTFNQVLLGIDPTNVSHSVTKSYADALVAGAFWTDVDVATIANVDLSNGLEAGDTIDDYVLVEGDRVLVKEQTDQTENGLYIVPASGAASRATDADSAGEIENKKCIPLNGVTTKHRLYFCITGDIELGVTDIKFAEVTQVSAHNTLSGIQGGQADQYYHLTSAEHVELNAWLDDVTLSNGGAMNLGTGGLIAANFTAAALLTACANNAGELDFTAASKKLDVEDNAVVSQDYTSDASPQFLGIELGHANDTTLTRASAGVMAIQGTNVMLVGDAPTAHTIVSHSDTTGTGANLNTLVGGGDVGALHTHAAAYQPLDTGLTNLAALGYVSDSMIKITAEDTYVIRTMAEVRTDLGLVIGTDVQAYDAELASLAALSYVSASFVKMTGANTFALRTIGETADDLEGTIDHDNLANGGAHDYSYISGNDGATGITGAELEELSDGSTTTLHGHAATGFGRPIVLTPQCSSGPAANFATHDTIAGGSTPNEVVSVLDFDADVSEYADFKIDLPDGYEGGGLTVTVKFSMTSDHDEGTPHKVRWEVGFARIDDDGIAISADHAYDFNGVSAIVPSVLTEVSYDNITFTNGADMDSLAAGEMAILRIYRDHDHADDNATGDAELQMIKIKET